jgi:antitoxin (DNA-binding transcriptional repressor) of toxin-antitoxin stability system
MAGGTNLSNMKVKVGQLKAGLSQYLREMQESGEPIEVCVREKAVAYLTPIVREGEKGTSLGPETIESLRAAGIRVVPAKKNKGDWVPVPGKALDGLAMANTVVAMRGEKDW